jgi:hypothetical protein
MAALVRPGTARLRRPGASGQALVEFALVFPLFFLLLVGIFDFGRIVWARSALENVAREGARYAIVHGGSELTQCPIGPDEMGRAGVCAGGSPSTDNAKTEAKKWAIAAGDNVAVNVCYGADCSGDTSTSTNKPGNPVTVKASSTIALIVPKLFRMIGIDLGTLTLDSSITMLVNT